MSPAKYPITRMEIINPINTLCDRDIDDGFRAAILAWTMNANDATAQTGRLGSYSPLGRFEELEFLAMGIDAKKQLWTTLRDLAGSRITPS
jgi:hypothetical protein